MNNEDWEKAAGPPCPKCGREALRFFDGKCHQCFLEEETAREIVAEDKSNRREISRQLREGTLSISQLRDYHS